jgi:cyanate lyase
VSLPALPPASGKADAVTHLLKAKEASGKTFSQIAKAVGLTNIYTAQLFYHQVCLMCWKFDKDNSSL